MFKSEHQPDYIFIATAIIILFTGLVVLSSASTVVGFQKFGDSYYFFKHQLLVGVLPGLILFYLAAKLDYQILKKIALPFFIITIILSFLVFLPVIGFSSGGAHRWIRVGGFIFQPSELLKLGFLLYLASWLDARPNRVRSWQEGFLPFIVVLVLVSLPIILQPDLGSLVVIFVIALSVYFMAGAKISHFLVLISAALIIVFLATLLAPYRLVRLTTFLHPSLDPQGIGYHIKQSLIAVGSGGFFGLGLGHSRQKYLYLPEAHGDSIFAVMAEELGFFMILAFLALVLLLVYRCLKIAGKAPDHFSKILVSGVMVWFVFQIFINIGAMINLFPLTGIPFPLVSSGGTAMVVFLTALGIVVNISKKTM
ncbi:MAG: putative lipid II flippase FtsW [Patescibacteria group bacterium]